MKIQMLTATALAALTTVSGAAFAAAPAEVQVGSRNDNRFAILQAHNLVSGLNCDRVDVDGDGKAETSRVVLLFGAGRGIGILTNSGIHSDFADATPATCATVQTLIDTAPMGFGFLQGSYSSKLVMTGDELVETIMVSIKSLDTSKPVSIMLNAQVRLPKDQ